ncbi:hypothetical protein DFH09DRAFT_949289, partial [Mycena vulgaris]
YTKYAKYDTPLADIYGANLPTLESIKAAVDPQNVMGLAGGFKFSGFLLALCIYGGFTDIKYTSRYCI